MTPADSAASAVNQFAERCAECRKLDMEIYKKPHAESPSLTAVERGDSFVLSALYGLNLDSSEPKLCFRCCRKNEPLAPQFEPVSGIFDFTQTLMNLVVANINREPSILKSYSACLGVSLLRYSRGEEIRAAGVVTNSVISDGAVIPLRELTSRDKMAERARFVPAYAAVAVHNMPFKGFDMYRNDWNLRKMNRKASYQKDLEIITNAPPVAVYGDIEVIRDYYIKAMTGTAPPDFDNRFPLITEYLGSNENWEREREYYRQLTGVVKR
ncbi:MAG: hypothetical protein LBD85_02200 [Oscillospiraceae bacterium]|jgi:hypothetical protein|nr:hypothetical protein [Oscillospiraceae bacterium]